MQCHDKFKLSTNVLQLPLTGYNHQFLASLTAENRLRHNVESTKTERKKGLTNNPVMILASSQSQLPLL